jgi:hypothetical protein
MRKGSCRGAEEQRALKEGKLQWDKKETNTRKENAPTGQDKDNKKTNKINTEPERPRETQKQDQEKQKHRRRARIYKRKGSR